MNIRYEFINKVDLALTLLFPRNDEGLEWRELMVRISLVFSVFLYLTFIYFCMNVLHISLLTCLLFFPNMCFQVVGDSSGK